MWMGVTPISTDGSQLINLILVNGYWAQRTALGGELCLTKIACCLKLKPVRQQRVRSVAWSLGYL